MESSKIIKVGVLTSSRADFGIYLPLLKVLKNHKNFNIDLIVFGTHLSKYHGNTVNEILDSGFKPEFLIKSNFDKDDMCSISTSYSDVSQKFSKFWKMNFQNFDYVFCLGDRFEMAAAVIAAVPYGLKFIHFHGGETTLGAIDNVYRDMISLSSYVHFVSTDVFKKRLNQLLSNNRNIYVTGSLSLQNINNINKVSLNSLSIFCGIDLTKKFILVTIHPETVNVKNNENYAKEMYDLFITLSKKWQIVISLPNADTNGSIYRKYFNQLKKLNPYCISLVENFGKNKYFSAISYCDFLIGNSSSGIIEAASFGKYVINLGDRQKGRLKPKNVIDMPFNRFKIENKVDEISNNIFRGINPYYSENPSLKIVNVLLNLK